MYAHPPNYEADLPIRDGDAVSNAKKYPYPIPGRTWLSLVNRWHWTKWNNPSGTDFSNRQDTNSNTVTEPRLTVVTRSLGENLSHSAKVNLSHAKPGRRRFDATSDQVRKFSLPIMTDLTSIRAACVKRITRRRTSVARSRVRKGHVPERPTCRRKARL